jgi:hypothetical protein
MREVSMGWSVPIRRKLLKKLMSLRLMEVLIQVVIQWKRLIRVNMMFLLHSSQMEHMGVIDGCLLQQFQL